MPHKDNSYSIAIIYNAKHCAVFIATQIICTLSLQAFAAEDKTETIYPLEHLINSKVITVASGYEESALDAASSIPADQMAIEQLFMFSIEDLLNLDVTSERRVEKLQDVPLAITALDFNELDNRSIKSLADLQYLVPGLTYSERRGQGSHLTIRGIGFEVMSIGSDPGVTLHLDGVYLQPISYVTHDLFDLERVEVLRGPQGTLYGRNAIGGSVNLISRAPTDYFLGKGKVSAGNYGYQAFQGIVSGPIAPGRLLGRLSLSTEQRDSFFDNISPGTQGDEAGELDYWSARGQLKYLIADRGDLTLRFNILQDDSVHDPQVWLKDYPSFPAFQGFDLRTDPPTPVIANFYQLNNVPSAPSLSDQRQYRSNLEEKREIDDQGFSLELNWFFDSATLTTISGINDSKRFQRIDIDGSDLLSWHTDNATTQSNTFSQEIRLASQNNSQLEWIAGLYFFKEEGDTFLHIIDESVPDLFGGPTFVEVEAEVKSKSAALFGQLTWWPSDQLGLTLGLRHTRDEKESTESILAPNFLIADPITQSLEDDWDQTTGKVGLEYRLQDDSLAYVTVSTGYKTGGMVVLGFQESSYGPESVLAYEAGLKTVMLDSRLKLNLAAFLYDYQDLQVRLKSELKTSVLNAAKATSKGIELELVAQVSEQLRIDAMLGWMDTRIDEFSTVDPIFPDLGVQDLTGNQLNRAPELKGNLGIQYNWSTTSMGQLLVRMDISWVDEMYFRFFNLERDKNDAFHRTVMRLIWQGPKQQWGASLWVKNLEDNDVISNIEQSSEQLGNAPHGVLSPPRTVGLTVDYWF